MHLPIHILVSTAAVPAKGRCRNPGGDRAGESFDSVEDYGVPLPRMDGSRTAADIQGTAFAAGSLVIDKSLSRIFVAAYLLTGSARVAEGVMLESRQPLDIDAIRSGCPSWKAIAAAIVRGNPSLEETPGDASPMLPSELLPVLRLSPGLRQCFVLHVLMAMPRHYCAGLLRIGAWEVDANSRLAARKLAGGAREATA